jgi:putative ABC transport system permease protein
VIAGIAGDPAVAEAEPRLRLPGVVARGDTSIEVSLELVAADAKLWRPRVAEGSFGAGTGGILLARRAAEDLGVSVGDEVTLRHPVRSGPGTLGAATTRVPVAGIHGSPFRPVAVLDAGWARRMGLAGAAHVVEVTPAPGGGVRAVQDALFGRPGVASVEAGEAGPKALADAMDRFGGVLQIGWLFALALAVLMAFNATSISAEERTREHATMFAFGLRPHVVLRIDVLENLVLGVLATAAGLALGVGILHWIVGSLVSETMPDLGLGAIVSSGTLIAAGLAGLLALGLAPLLTARRLRRMDVPSALRVME